MVHNDCQNKSKITYISLYYSLNVDLIIVQGKPGEVEQAIKDAIDVGYRLFDCAHVYGNEREIGKAIADKIADGTVKREDLFVTSKLWNTFHKPELVEAGIRRSLEDFGLDYLDLYLIHWPIAYKEGPEFFPKHPDGSHISDPEVDYVDTWKAMEKLLEKGLTRSIGVSNFNSEQLVRIIESSSTVPVTNQV